jgi:RNA polymerase sigma-70 factor (ECF subfamily)
MPPTDAELIAASWSEGAAFGAIFDRHFGRVFRFCARRTGQHAAEDLAGEVFRRAFEHRLSYDTARHDATPWLLAIALNLVRDATRSSLTAEQVRRRLEAFEAVRPAGLDDVVASRLDAKRRLVAVAAALELAPDDEVEPLLLYVWDELSYAEIAEVLAIPVGTVRSRLNRVRHRLLELLDDASGSLSEVITPPSGGTP